VAATVKEMYARALVEVSAARAQAETQAEGRAQALVRVLAPIESRMLPPTESRILPPEVIVPHPYAPTYQYLQIRRSSSS